MARADWDQATHAMRLAFNVRLPPVSPDAQRHLFSVIYADHSGRTGGC